MSILSKKTNPNLYCSFDANLSGGRDSSESSNNTLQSRIMELEERVARLEDQLGQARKIEASGRLSRGIAHDSKKP